MEGMTLEQLLDQMTLYARPKLHNMDDGTWYCACDMLVTGVGVSFKIASDFKHPTPVSAAQQCYDRMLDALRSINDSSTKVGFDPVRIGKAEAGGSKKNDRAGGGLNLWGF